MENETGRNQTFGSDKRSRRGDRVPTRSNDVGGVSVECSCWVWWARSMETMDLRAFPLLSDGRAKTPTRRHGSFNRDYRKRWRGSRSPNIQDIGIRRP